MKKKSFLFGLIVLSLSIFFISCEKDENLIDTHNHSHNDENIISFREFIDKTKIKNFNANINLFDDNSQNLRQATDFTGFIIDTTLVKQRLQESGNYTFTLPVIPQPYINTENLFYNIVFYKASNTWQWSVLEYENISANSKNYIVKEIVNESNHNGLVNMRLQGVWSTTTTFHCTQTGPCARGTCDMCHLCVTTTTTYEYVSLEDPTSQFEIIEDYNNIGGGSGGLSSALQSYFNTLTTDNERGIFLSNTSLQNYLQNNTMTVPNPHYNPRTTGLLGGVSETIEVVTPEAQQFADELIDFYSEENIFSEEDLKNKIKQAIANGITSTAELAHKIFKKFSELAEDYPSSITYINSVLETINDAAATVTNTNPSTCTFGDLFNMWLFELGPNPINFNGNTVTTEQLKTQEGVNQARQSAILKYQNGIYTQTTNGWSYGQTQFYDGMANGNLVTAFLGSYTTYVNIVSTPNGYALSFHVTNPSSWESATRFRIDNDNNNVHDGIFPNTGRNNDGDLSMGGNFTQNWYWTEPLN